MSDLALQSDRTAVLVMDYQRLLVSGYVPESETTLARVSDVLDRSRKAGLPVFYITVGFREGYPEVNDNNKIFTGVRDGGRFQLGDEGTQVPTEIAPYATDVVVIKHRVSAFVGTDLEVLLKARGIDTLVLFGITTSGVVLSTVRQGADLDYRLIVLSDLCHDSDDVHRFLVEEILTRQADIVSSEQFVQSLRAL